jgi:type III pantothenate kinase
MHLFDIGNTNIKYFKDGVVESFKAEESFEFLDDKFYYINVNSSMKKRVQSYKNGINLEDKIEFKTSYKGMGIDRKVVCKALNDGVIVDAGSAITVDVMDNSVHKGGFISLGLYSFRQSFANISDKLLYEVDAKIDLDKLPQNTSEALNYAALQSIVLMIKNVSKDKKIYFCGGDGKILSSFFENSTYKKDLIFDGMKEIIKESGC